MAIVRSRSRLQIQIRGRDGLHPDTGGLGNRATAFRALGILQGLWIGTRGQQAIRFEELLNPDRFRSDVLKNLPQGAIKDWGEVVLKQARISEGAAKEALDALIEAANSAVMHLTDPARWTSLSSGVSHYRVRMATLGRMQKLTSREVRLGAISLGSRRC